MIKEFRQCGTKVTTLDDAENSDNLATFLLQMLNMTLPEVTIVFDHATPKMGLGGH
jgi:hypothetical protein